MLTLQPMGVIAANAELAIRDALSKESLPDSIEIRLCLGGTMVLPLIDALRTFADRRRAGDDEGILAQRPELLARIDEILEA